MSRDADLTVEVRALARLDLEGLRQAWRDAFGEPPATRSVELLRLCLAWRLQAGEHGGLDAGLRRRLRDASAPASPPLGEGARILKEWGGVLHQVDRTAEGFLWEGRTYPSLSKVAEVMTGVKRNGPRFFGLREGSTR